MNIKNQVQLIGHLGQDPELKRLDGGRAVISFSLATSESWIDKATGEQLEHTDWHRVKAWGPFAEIMFDKLRKGQKVVVSGRLKYDSYDDKNGSKQVRAYILAEGFERMTAGTGSRDSSGENNTTADEPQIQPTDSTGTPEAKDFDDLPF